MRVLAAMSGGVDSSVAAARAVAAGHDVVGVHLALSRDPQTLRNGARGCCSLEDSADARRVCDKLGIPFYVWDFSERFRAEVIEDFVASYQVGETPNPCLRCNERIKFEALLDRGIALGYDAVVTGHYARLGEDGLLRRAVDMNKDQSYVLGVLNREQIDHSMFPLGDTTKPDIRLEAQAAGLNTASKPDSHDICFIPDGNTQAFLGARIGRRPGTLVDHNTGETLGEHDGVDAFTIGQRKGIGLPNPRRDGKPRYVTGLDAETGTVKVGTIEDLDITQITADRLVWIGGQQPADGEQFSCQVQVRAHGEAIDATAQISSDGGEGATVQIVLERPFRGVAPGQAAVLYQPDADGDIVLGSGTIIATGR